MTVIVKDGKYISTNLAPKCPKAPALNALLSDSNGEQSVKLLSFLDTGADVTCVRMEKILELQSKLGYDLPLMSVRDRKTGEKIPTYVVCVTIGEVPLESGSAVYCPVGSTFDLEDALIGRDILNQLKLTLDGPNMVFTIEKP